MSLGTRLREERNSLGLSQAALAARCGVRRQSQVEFEKDTHVPGGAYLIAASREGVDVTYVMIGERGMARIVQPLNEALLRTAMEATEQYLTERGRHWPVARKADLVILLYRIFHAEQTEPARDALVAYLTRKAA